MSNFAFIKDDKIPTPTELKEFFDKKWIKIKMVEIVRQDILDKICNFHESLLADHPITCELLYGVPQAIQTQVLELFAKNGWKLLFRYANTVIITKA